MCALFPNILCSPVPADQDHYPWVIVHDDETDPKGVQDIRIDIGDSVLLLSDVKDPYVGRVKGFFDDCEEDFRCVSVYVCVWGGYLCVCAWVCVCVCGSVVCVCVCGSVVCVCVCVCLCK